MNDPVSDIVRELPVLRRYAYSLCRGGQGAEDLLQSTMVRALANIHQFEPGSSLLGWLYVIMRNEMFSGFRGRKREVGDPGGVHAASLVQPASQEDHVHLGEVGEAMSRLSPERREALMLVKVAGLSYEDAARISGVQIGTMKSRVNRARAALVDG